MTIQEIGIAGVVAMLALLALRVPVGIALAVTGALGLAALTGLKSASAQIMLVLMETGGNFLFVALPLFVLMGQLVYATRIAEDLFDCVYKWCGWLPGGLAVTSTVSCAAFGAVTGSSPVAVSTMGTMTMPEMRRYRYDMRLATGSIAAAGTLAIIIPPSVIMIVYGIWTETSIGKLFIAGIVPGLILTLGFSAYIIGRCLVTPSLGPPGPAFSWPERIRALVKLLPIALIFMIVLGGIYGGVFTPTEASGIGVAGVLAVALAMRRLSWRALRESLYETGLISGMVFLVVIGGVLISRFLVQTQITPAVIDAITGHGLNRYAVMVLLTLLYIVLGMILDVFGMLLLTLPFVFPIVIGLGFDPIWFGIYITIVCEVALITPPVGINCFIMKTVAPEVSLSDIFRGCVPFVAVCLAVIGLLLAVPDIALWLPLKMV